MAKLEVFNDIVNEEDKVFLREWCGTDGVCYKDIQEFISSIPDDDNAIDIHIHCRGGDCVEGWAIYDALRSSGKEISAYVEGECSSMATIILLAAPSERRYSQKHAHICIHNPAVDWVDTDCYSRLTPDNLDKLASAVSNTADTLRKEQDKILDLYVERTGSEREELQALMDQDTFISADRAKELGFVSVILAPNTAKRKSKNNNKFTSKMAKPNKTKAKSVAVRNSVLDRLLAKAGLARLEDLKMKAQVVTAADGSELTVDREDGDPQVGDVARPDGTYVLEDGTTIVVEGEVITSIEQPNDGASDLSDDPEEIREQIAELQARLAELDPEAEPVTEEQVEELQEQVDELQKTVDEQAEALKKAKVLSANEKTILARVQKAGGIAWLDKVMNMRSTFTPQNRRFVEAGSHSTAPANETKTQKAIRERREAAERKRAARK